MGENIDAIPGEIRTQQRNRSYYSQIAASVTVNIIQWLINNQNALFTLLRFSQPDPEPSGEPNPTRKKIEISALVVALFLYIVQAIAVQSFFYYIFHATENEKQELLFYELMRDLLKNRRYAIEEDGLAWKK